MSRFVLFILAAMTLAARAADPAAESFTGHFELAKNTSSPFALDVTQKGKAASMSFSAGHADGSGAAPEGKGDGVVTATGEVEFKWSDSFDNAGTATLRRDGKLFHLSMKVGKATEPRALVFYGEMTLKRTSMKPQPSTR